MDINLNCNQVESLFNFYIEGKLAPSLYECVKKHIETCPKCLKKFKNWQNSFPKMTQNIEIKRGVDREFHNNLSAYVDNELDTAENVKIKKIAISNPTARQELEAMYKYQKLLHSAYEKTKNNTKFDYSKNIMAIINESEVYTTSYFRNFIIVSSLIFIAIICGFIYLYS